MKNIWHKIGGGKNILPVLVFLLLIFTIVQSIILIKLNCAVKQGTIIDEPDKDLNKNLSLNDDFFKHFDSHSWDPMNELQSMRDRMDRMFDDSHNRLRASPFFDEKRYSKDIMPQTNLEEKSDSYIVTMNIPGSDKSEINVDLEDDRLIVSAKTKKSSTDKKDKKFLRMERRTGSFYRALDLPGSVDEGAMDTKYEDGILTIILPKQK